MGRPKFKIACDKCKKNFDELYGKGYYNNNKDSNFYCKKCYKKVFKEEFEEGISDEILEKLEEHDE